MNRPSVPAGGLRSVGCDRVFLRDHVLSLDVGILPQEHGVLQRVRFDVTLEIAASDGPETDTVPAVSYVAIVEAIDALATGRRTGLLETLAEALCADLLSDPAVLRATARLEKLDRLDSGGAFGVEIVRERTDAVTDSPAAAPLVPR